MYEGVQYFLLISLAYKSQTKEGNERFIRRICYVLPRLNIFRRLGKRKKERFLICLAARSAFSAAVASIACTCLLSVFPFTFSSRRSFLLRSVCRPQPKPKLTRPLLAAPSRSPLFIRSPPRVSRRGRGSEGRAAGRRRSINTWPTYSDGWGRDDRRTDDRRRSRRKKEREKEKSRGENREFRETCSSF